MFSFACNGWEIAPRFTTTKNANVCDSLELLVGVPREHSRGKCPTARGALRGGNTQGMRRDGFLDRFKKTEAEPEKIKRPRGVGEGGGDSKCFEKRLNIFFLTKAASKTYHQSWTHPVRQEPFAGFKLRIVSFKISRVHA